MIRWYSLFRIQFVFVSIIGKSNHIYITSLDAHQKCTHSYTNKHSILENNRTHKKKIEYAKRTKGVECMANKNGKKWTVQLESKEQKEEKEKKNNETLLRIENNKTKTLTDTYCTFFVVCLPAYIYMSIHHASQECSKWAPTIPIFTFVFFSIVPLFWFDSMMLHIYFKCIYLSIFPSFFRIVCVIHA